MKFLKKLKSKFRFFLVNNFNLNINLIKKNIYKNIETPDKANINAILNAKGILHIGAHRGSERYMYDHFGKPVIWIEANPNIYKELKLNLKEFKYQIAYNNLLYSKSNVEKFFYLSSNDGASSSVKNFSDEFLKGEIEFEDKKRDIEMRDKIIIKTITLDKLIFDNKIEINNFDHWIIDVQGAELEVLEGAEKNLEKCSSLVIEISTKKFYENCALWNEVKNFLKSKNFSPVREPFKNHEDILFLNNK